MSETCCPSSRRRPEPPGGRRGAGPVETSASAGVTAPGGRIARVATLPLILLARFWQMGPSRLIPATCRYSPSCSAYAITSWRRHGLWRGSLLAAGRLLRCHPWGGCGHDPVPPAPVPPLKDQHARV